jgi:Chalcone isomerase-like
MKRSAFFALLVTVLLALSSALPALALDKGADGWFHTGDGIRVKTIAFVNFKVYAIGHDMKDLPDAKSKQAVIDLDTTKRFTWRMMRDVDQGKIQNALKEAFAMNGFSDGGRIGQFVGAFNGDLKEGQYVTITYDSGAKATTIRVLGGGGSATVPGVDFMKATWSIWFGKIDQPSLGDALISKM